MASTVRKAVSVSRIITPEGRFILNGVERPTCPVDESDSAWQYIDQLDTSRQYVDLAYDGEKIAVVAWDGTHLGHLIPVATDLYGGYLRAVMADGYTPSIEATMRNSGDVPVIQLHMRQDRAELVWGMYEPAKAEKVVEEKPRKRGLFRRRRK